MLKVTEAACCPAGRAHRTRERSGRVMSVPVHVLCDSLMREIAWITLFFAGLLETGWALGLKYTDGFTKIVPTVTTLVLMAGSFYLLSRSLSDLPLGTAYAVWTGIGAIGTVIAGIMLFGESRSVIRLLCLLLIISGIVGLKLCSDA